MTTKIDNIDHGQSNVAFASTRKTAIDDVHHGWSNVAFASTGKTMINDVGHGQSNKAKRNPDSIERECDDRKCYKMGKRLYEDESEY